MQEILGLVRRCVTDYDMIQEGETVAVGVSGGKDSHFQVYILKEVMHMNPCLLYTSPSPRDRG